MTKSRGHLKTTVLPANECAVITTDNGSRLEVLVPDLGDEHLSPVAMFLVACAMRYVQDPDFVQAQVDWLEERVGGKETKQ